ncbi:MAG: HI0074 family nucleotidyltransferase substrate-binding subunit [Halobacteriota archaeon]
MMAEEAGLESFEHAILRLEAALEYDPEVLDIALDAVIQRFEFTFERGWKSIRRTAKAVGYDCKSPRGCLKLAYKMERLEDEEKWLRLLAARNLTPHTYDQETAMEVYETVKDTFEVFKSLLKELRKEI